MSEQPHLGGKVILKTLPVLEGSPGPAGPDRRHLKLPQGDLIQLHNSAQPVHYLALIQLRSGGVRGNHYHIRKQEHVYVLEGEIALIVEDLDGAGRETLTVRAGDLVFLPPRVAHALCTVHPGWAVEFTPAPLDPADSYRHSLTP